MTYSKTAEHDNVPEPSNHRLSMSPVMHGSVVIHTALEDGAMGAKV